ncbi:hypothetical protein EVAR_27616_1 [Eumeta japonica]|uniref:Uncharacterized protein n=1 Tax=Eumeta variegata TaxID=151549 RepID=A0A4C1V0B6_EUMVA|nr:hypothetical protein EVAR_27616_1 [Eumeta japonica]
MTQKSSCPLALSAGHGGSEGASPRMQIKTSAGARRRRPEERLARSDLMNIKCGRPRLTGVSACAPAQTRGSEAEVFYHHNW